jgi:DNA primase
MMYNEAVKKKVTDYFISRLNCRPYKRGWYKGKCPYCNAIKFGFRLSDFRTHCFKCGNLGDPIKFIMELEGFNTYPEVYGFLKTFDGVEFYEKPIEEKPVDVTAVTLPPSFKLLSIGHSSVGDLARSYVKKRGFSPLTLSMMGVGYCSTGDFAGMIILPFHRDGKLIYFIGRRYLLLGANKFNNPDAEKFGIGKSELIFNEDALHIHSTIYIVESVFNALTLGSNAIAILGKKISNIQLSKILRSPCKNFIICLDPDGYSDALQLAFKLVETKRVKVIKFPEGKDVNDLGKAWVRARRKETPFQTHGDLISLKAN